MARDGKKIEEFKIYLNSRSYPATLRMTDQFEFILEVNQLRFRGNNPKDLIHQAQMQLENEDGLKWSPIILVDPDLEEGRLNFKRLFQAKSRDGKEVWRSWRFDGDDERQLTTWNRTEVETHERLEGGVPGDRADGPRVKDREMEYTPERWTAIVKLDQMLEEARKAVSEKLSDIIRKGDLDLFLKRATQQGTLRLIFDEATK
jgi:hypothetical protein